MPHVNLNMRLCSKNGAQKKINGSGCRLMTSRYDFTCIYRETEMCPMRFANSVKNRSGEATQYLTLCYYQSPSRRHCRRLADVCFMLDFFRKRKRETGRVKQNRLS